MNIPNEKELQELQLFLDELISNIQYISDKTKATDSILYWTNVRMYNYRQIFSDYDRNLIEELHVSMEHLLPLQENILSISKNIQEDIKKIIKAGRVDENQQHTEIIGIIEVVNLKINTLRNLYFECNEGYKQFAEKAKKVRLIIYEKAPRKKMTIGKKIKNGVINFCTRR